jgi:hypothetical protein
MSKLWPQCCPNWAICPHFKTDREVAQYLDTAIKRAIGDLGNGYRNSRIEASIRRWEASHEVSR